METIKSKDEAITDIEAALLSRGRIERFAPNGDAEQRAVWSLIERGLMTLNGQYHNDNQCWTTFSGGYALATHSARKR